MRYDEDYAFLKNDSLRTVYPKMKFVLLSANKKTFISYGGEIRFQYFFSKNEQWGDASLDSDGYILTRCLAHADFHTGKYFRTFVQLQSSIAGSRVSPSPIDDNPLELHQAFLDISNDPVKRNRIIYRFGRQELLYGSQRLVSVRDGPNNRQSFDGIRSLFNSGSNKLDLFYSHSVAAGNNIFDDGFNKYLKFWGAYFVRNNIPVIKNFDLYYLGLWKKNATFNDGSGRELRHSFGTRIWSNKGDWKYDIESLYQFGNFAEKKIAAWTASINTSYKFSSAKFKPELGLKTELISGDKEEGNNKLQTFNPLFPRGAYFGLAALIGPTNLIDVHPSVSFELAEKIKFEIDYDLFWRYSPNDGFYAVNLSLIYPDGNTSETKIGNQLSATFVYAPNAFMYFRGEFTYFNAGAYLKAVSQGKDILFTGITAQLKL